MKDTQKKPREFWIDPEFFATRIGVHRAYHTMPNKDDKAKTRAEKYRKAIVEYDELFERILEKSDSFRVYLKPSGIDAIRNIAREALKEN